MDGDASVDFAGVRKLLPHRFPFLMIDHVLSVDPGREAVAVKNVSGNDMFSLGHFPQRAVLPGTLIIEAMAQTAILLFAAGAEQDERSGRTYFLGSVKARFHRPVVPGDCLVITAQSVRTLDANAFVSSRVFVGDDLVSEADIVMSARDD